MACVANPLNRLSPDWRRFSIINCGLSVLRTTNHILKILSFSISESRVWWRKHQSIGGGGIFAYTECDTLGDQKGVRHTEQEKQRYGYIIDCVYPHHISHWHQRHIAHRGCLQMVCEYINILSQTGRDTLISLIERHEMLGLTVYGGYEMIDYSEGRLLEKWKNQRNGRNHGGVFNWNFSPGVDDYIMKR